VNAFTEEELLDAVSCYWTVDYINPARAYTIAPDESHNVTATLMPEVDLKDEGGGQERCPPGCCARIAASFSSRRRCREESTTG
jgi:hypothetical protein